MEKLKKFVKKNQILLIAVCVCIAALTATFFAGGNLSNDKVQTASTAPSISASTDTETTSVSVTEGTTQKSTDSTKSDKNKKDKKDKKSSEDKQNSNTDSQNKNSSAVEKSEKSESSSKSDSSSNKNSSSANSSSNSSSSSKKNDVQPTTQDKYKTDPVPSGKPKPVEPEEKVTTDTNLYCTFTITCSTILDNMNDLDPEKVELVPKDGIILKKQKVQFKEGESVYDVLVRVCKDNKIHMESSWTPMYNSAYVEGINNLYEFDCGSLSGWMYKVNEWFPNYGCSRYELKNGDDVVWCYTCNLGYDVGGGYATGEE